MLLKRVTLSRYLQCWYPCTVYVLPQKLLRGILHVHTGKVKGRCSSIHSLHTQVISNHVFTKLLACRFVNTKLVCDNTIFATTLIARGNWVQTVGSQGFIKFSLMPHRHNPLPPVCLFNIHVFILSLVPSSTKMVTQHNCLKRHLLLWNSLK